MFELVHHQHQLGNAPTSRLDRRRSGVPETGPRRRSAASVMVLGSLLLMASGCGNSTSPTGQMGGGTWTGDAQDSGGTDVAMVGPGDVTAAEDGAGADVTGLDATVDLDATLDADATSGPKPAGQACKSSSDCTSTICLWGRDGQVCAEPCEAGKCKTGWVCGTINPDDPNAVEACVERDLNLCRPCQSSADCKPGSGACVNGSAGGGRFCATSCVDKDGCPTGFSCEKQQCRPSSGTCACSAWAAAVKAQTACKVSNDAGACPGVRGCATGTLSACVGAPASAEICDGLDNDCDGQTDESLNLLICLNKSAIGSCKGMEQCAAGELTCGAPAASEEICDGKDNNCDGEIDEGFLNTDADKKADCIDDDDDGDGVLDATDNCVLTPNKDQADNDKDGKGDACDPDDDNDGLMDKADNCPLAANITQTDTDGDKLGDACDPDDDNDNVPDQKDNCPWVVNVKQMDTDKDGKGNLCDEDDDNDGVFDTKDNCPLVANKGQLDTDGDKLGDACDPDDDDDGVIDTKDNCPLVANQGQLDTDKDQLGDACDPDKDGDDVPNTQDNCPLLANKGQLDTDGDKLGDVCDPDDDNDKVSDEKDNCPLKSNANQSDIDKDGQGDVCDLDMDGDKTPNIKDNCPKVSNPTQLDTDKDKQGDACDTDDDGDKVLDVKDNCPLIANTDQKNTDGDKQGDACDSDDDGDGDPDTKDCAPLDKAAYHGATEICDGKDNNCDKVVDEENAKGCTIYFPDQDKDGYAVLSPKRCLCKPSTIWTVTNIGKADIDCAPNNKAINPGAKEVCDGIDNNCVKGIDEIGAGGCKVYYYDADNDGFGGPLKLCLCKPTIFFSVLKGGDCYDKNNKAFPGQTLLYSTDRGDGSFDYNCDKKETFGFFTTLLSVNEGKCNAPCNKAELIGWVGTPFVCGKVAKFLKGCSMQPSIWSPMIQVCVKTTNKFTVKCE